MCTWVTESIIAVTQFCVSHHDGLSLMLATAAPALGITSTFTNKKKGRKKGRVLVQPDLFLLSREHIPSQKMPTNRCSSFIGQSRVTWQKELSKGYSAYPAEAREEGSGNGVGLTK